MTKWSGKWVGYKYDPSEDIGVFAFQNVLTLDEKPVSFPIRVSADNRYKLYVNGEMIAFGPQRGDERHWFYDSVDLAPYLSDGENLIVALVWNFGWMAPMAQHSVRTAFLFDSDVESMSTPGSWTVSKLDEWGFAMMHSTIGDFYIDIGPGEIIRPVLEAVTRNPREGKPVHGISHAEDRGSNGGGTPWMLIPRALPAMRYETRKKVPAVRHGFVGSASPSSEAKSSLIDPVDLAPGEKLLLDYSELLCAYPRLVLSGPEGAAVKLTYAEAMWNADGSKRNRDDVDGKEMRGYQDKLILGPEPAIYEPLWWRTYRYLMIEAADAVHLHSIDAIETGYPYPKDSSFEADDPSVAKIWEVSVRTAERCAGETYFDCPYYEQLQYVGDTRIQALIGYYMGRDRDLQRNAVETLGWSLMENGITQSRYPSRQTQVIPPFSLWWVMMLYDQMLYDTGGRPDFVSPQTLFRVLGRYRKLSESDAQFWQFGDWVPDWTWGVPPGGARSLMHQLTLMHATAAAASLKAHMEGKPHFPVKLERWRDYAAGACQYGGEHGYLAGSRYADVDSTPSEHAEAMFRLLREYWEDHSSTSEPDALTAWPHEALEQANAARCTYYFSYYKHLAMQPDDYLAQLGPWKEMIEEGLSTFAENPAPTRSDCHAWSAHPILGFFQLIAGVTSIAPAWKKARIAPKPGALKRFDARIAHPEGELRVAYEGEKLRVESPIPFELLWKGKKETLEPGTHEF